MTLSKGTLIGARYRLEKEIGRGGSSVVWCAVDARSPRKLFAVKFLSEQLSSDPPARARFETEIKILECAFRLSASIVAIVDHGSEPALYIVTTLYDSGSLKQQFDRRLKLFAVVEVLEIGIQIAGALLAADSEGISHLDLKPENVLTTPDLTQASGFRCMLTDFGISKIRGTAAVPSGDPLGTAAYMAPEQWLGNKGGDDAASDVYSLGVVLYELFAGRRPFEAEDDEDLFSLHQEQVPDLLPLKHRCVPEGAVSLIARMLHKVAGQRPRTADVLAELKDVLARECARSIPRETRAPLPLLRIPVSRRHPRGELAPQLLAGKSTSSRGVGRLLAGAILLAGGLLAILAAGALVVRGSNSFLTKASLRPAPPTASKDSHAPKTVHFPPTTYSMGASAEDNAHGCARLGPFCLPDLMAFAMKVRVVTLSAFDLDAFEVTNGQFENWLSRDSTFDIRPEQHPSADAPTWRTVWDREGKTGHLLFDSGKKTGQRISIVDKDKHEYRVDPNHANEPVVNVTWYGAKLYCKSLGKRLPTEAEWELAARGVLHRTFAWGEEDARCDDTAFGRNEHDTVQAECPGRKQGPDNVGSNPHDRTPEDVWDLAGNVAEWVLDDFKPEYPACESGCKDPVVSGNDDGPHVFRGGAWSFRRTNLLTWIRDHLPADAARKQIGFRCVNDHKEQQ